MALTVMTSSPAAVTDAIALDAPPDKLRKSLTITGDDAFTGATLAEVAASGWLVAPATCDKDVPFYVTYDTRKLRPGDYTTTLRVTSDAITVDVVFTLRFYPRRMHA